MKSKTYIQGFSLFKIGYIMVTLLCFGFSDAQTTASIKKIRDNYQNCLDKADFMLGCSYDYYNKSDSLLHVVNQKIEIRLNKDQKIKFRKEQLKWLKKRASYFKKLRKDILKDGGLVGDDLKMIVADKQAEYILERVEELMKRL